jgi:hypothetical protein
MAQGDIYPSEIRLQAERYEGCWKRSSKRRETRKK